jgi:hypothetical protein
MPCSTTLRTLDFGADIDGIRACLVQNSQGDDAMLHSAYFSNGIASIDVGAR